MVALQTTSVKKKKKLHPIVVEICWNNQPTIITIHTAKSALLESGIQLFLHNIE